MLVPSLRIGDFQEDSTLLKNVRIDGWRDHKIPLVHTVGLQMAGAPACENHLQNIYMKSAVSAFDDSVVAYVMLNIGVVPLLYFLAVSKQIILKDLNTI
jgi:hypothetical protein